METGLLIGLCLASVLVVLCLIYIIPAKISQKGAIVFFDGQCGLCNGFVDFVLQRDKQFLFRFSPLQSDYAATQLGAAWTQHLSTIVVQTHDQKILSESDAALYVCEGLGRGWRLCAWLRIIPKSIRNTVYQWIARNRYKWFGKREICRLPTPEEQARFILL